MGIVSAAPFRTNVMFIRFVLRGLMALGLVGVSALPALAMVGEVDTGDTAWILSATALVLFMTLPGTVLCRLRAIEEHYLGADASFCHRLPDVGALGRRWLFAGLLR